MINGYYIYIFFSRGIKYFRLVKNSNDMKEFRKNKNI